MAYQSKHTGTNIDAGIDINTTQNNRLTALENKDATLQNNIDAVNSNLNTNMTAINAEFQNLQNQITALQSSINSLTSILDNKVNKDQVFLGYDHTQIPANSNLNNYLNGGTYCCSSSANANTISNCPVGEAFTMFVYNAVGGGYATPPSTATYSYIRQIIIPFDSIKIYMRMISYDGKTTPTYHGWAAV